MMSEAVEDRSQAHAQARLAHAVPGACATARPASCCCSGSPRALPFALFLGTLFAWLTEAEVDLETMGVFSLIGSVVFVPVPVVAAAQPARRSGMRRLGKRKQWIVLAQLAARGDPGHAGRRLDPKTSLGWFSLLAAIGAFASATQDIVINAWRIDVADDEAPLDILSTVYQMGYRLSSLVGGALALIVAARIGWPQTYLMMGAILLAIGALGLFAPDAESQGTDRRRARSDGRVAPHRAN